MNKIKKALLLALSMAMSATLFAACKDKNNGGTQSSSVSSEVSSSVEVGGSEDASSSEAVSSSEAASSEVVSSEVVSSEVVSSETVSSEVVSSEEESSSEESSEPAEEITVEIIGSSTVVEFESITLSANVTGAEDDMVVAWESSDETVATVDANGVVTGHKAGTVTITASIGGESATMDVEVVKTTLLHEIQFSMEELKLYVDETDMIDASVVFNGETLDNDEYGLEYTWEKISGEDGVVEMQVNNGEAVFVAKTPGTVVYKVSTTARGYVVENTISVTVMENEYSYKIANEKIVQSDNGYKTKLTLIADATLDIGVVNGVLNGEPQDDELTVAWSTESDVISVVDGVITANKAGEGVITGATEYGGEAISISLTVTVVKHQVALEDKLTLETTNAETIALPEEASTNVEMVTLGKGVLFDGANGVGSIDGMVVTVDQDALPCKDSELGKNKTLTVETDTTVYTIPVDVYTMIINTAEELDQWQAIAAENAVKAGLCIAEQKGITYSGYFILGDDIEYNKVWTPYAPFAGKKLSLYELCYNNADIFDEEGKLKDGAFQEDWGAGRQGGFKGTFDGDGHYIHGMETQGDYSGFIITMGIGGIIKNVAFTGAKIGTNGGLVANRGNGTLENIFVQVDAMESGSSASFYTHVVIRDGNQAERYYNNIVVDLSKIDFANMQYAFVMDSASASSNGIYVIGAEDALFARGVAGWTEGSDDNGSWTESQACVFWHFLEGDDVGGSFATTADLLADEAHATLINAWDSNMWTITDNVVIAKSVKGMYTQAIAIENEETRINAGTSAVITTNVNKAYVSLALKEEVEGVSIDNKVISVAEDVAIGTKFTVVATSLLDGTTAEMEFTSAPKIVALDYTTTIETTSDAAVALPSDLEGTISKITIGSVVVYDSAKEIGSIADNALTLGADIVKMSDLGDNVAMTIETDSAKYEMTVSVYTMIIDNAAELEMFYNAAADNALAAGLNIEAQKGFTQTGYFVLGADIEYNKIWTHIPFGDRWAMCYESDGAGGTREKQSLYNEDGTLKDGAIIEDWGAGDKGGFHGVFDGKGYAIKGLELKGEYAGFIGTMGRDGVLKNVAFTDLKLGQKTGLVERGGKGGFVENVYIEIDSIESGTGPNDMTKLMTQHGNTKLTNIVVNVSGCDFTGIEYVYLLNCCYNEADNIYVIDRDYIADTKTDFNTDAGTAAFWHFNPYNDNDTGAKFATVAGLLADETHGAVVSAFGGYWSVVDGKLYFGDEEVVTAPEKEFDLTEYKTDLDKKVTLENASLTEGSVWSVSVNGGEAIEYTVTEAGKATVTVDADTLDSYQAKVVFSSEEKVLSFSNVIAVTYITDVEDLKLIGRGRNSTTATDHAKGYYALANDITFEHAADYSDVIAAGYHKASGTFGTAGSYSFQGVFDGNGYKLINMRVSDGGMFGYMENATVKNLKLTNVHILDSLPQTVSNESGGYAAILAYTAPGTTFEDIEISIASSPAAVWTWKRYGLFVVSSSSGAATYRNITVDASYVELKFLLGISHNANNVYENVLIKAAKYHAIGYTADSYGSGGVDNVAAKMTEFPAGGGITFEKVAHAEIPNQPMNANLAKLPAYTGDVTALGFAEGSNVFAVANANLWNDRILFPADSATSDYVEFDVVLSTDIAQFTAWPQGTGNTDGSMTIRGAQMDTTDGKIRTVQVFDKDGNTFAAQYTGGFKANTLYTIRVCFAEGETVKYIHLGMGTAQTYYVSNARWGTFGAQNDVYTSATGALLAKYEGDVTALGFEEGATVTQTSIADGWNNRVGINGSIKYDYVDVKFSYTGDRQVSSLCVWVYGTNGGIITGNYSVSATGCSAANGAGERTIQIFDAEGNAVESLAANTVYTLRVYLNSNVSTFAVSTFDTSAESTAILNFGDITYGNNA